VNEAEAAKEGMRSIMGESNLVHLNRMGIAGVGDEGGLEESHLSVCTKTRKGRELGETERRTPYEHKKGLTNLLT